MKARHRLFVVLCATLLLIRSASADVLNVGPGQSFTTIASAITAANSGDTLLIEDGLYAETLTIGKPLRLEARNVGGPVIDAGGGSANVIEVNAPSSFFGLVVQNGNSGIVSRTLTPTAADFIADRIIARNLTGAAFSVNTLGARVGTAVVNNATIVDTSSGFNINDGNQIIATNAVLTNVNSAYVIQNGNSILPSHSLFFDVANRESCGPICGTFGVDPDELTADPLFVDPSQADYRLQALSPAIDSGTDAGLAFFGLAPDRGAFEVVPEPTGNTAIAIACGWLVGAIRRKLR